MSGTNPNIENILGFEPTSFSVEATGKDSTMFLWYYSFELPELEMTPAPGELSKIDLMVKMDTTLTDYNLKYFEHIKKKLSHNFKLKIINNEFYKVNIFNYQKHYFLIGKRI